MAKVTDVFLNGTIGNVCVTATRAPTASGQGHCM